MTDDVKSATCPNQVTTTNYALTYDKQAKRETIKFKFDKKVCEKCPLNDNCLKKNSKGKLYSGRYVVVPRRYDAVLHDLKRIETEEFKEAMKKRYKVERRFATMVRNHGLRCSRYLRIFVGFPGT
ncbi:MAG: transposase [Lutisporaceae bacterium]